MKIKAFIPARLKVQTEDGEEFVETSRVLREPELRDHCLEKRELKRIMKILQKLEVLPEQRPKSAPRPRRTTVSKLSKHHC
jgi:hypothetical protein